MSTDRDDALTLSVESAAKLLGISRGVAYDAVRRGQIPSVRFGERVIRVPKHALDVLLGNGSVEGAQED